MYKKSQKQVRVKETDMTKKRTKLKKSLALMLAVAMLVAMVSVSYTYAAGSAGNAGNPENKPMPPMEKTIRVGLFSSFNESAEVNGEPYVLYTKAFLERIALYTGWHFEYVEVDIEKTKVEDLLVEGKIDLATVSAKTDDNRDMIGFSNLPYGILESHIITLTENDEIFSSDYSTLEDARIAIVEGDKYHEALLEKFCALNGINYTTVLVPDYESALEAMQSGVADAAVAVNVISISDTKTVAVLGETPFFFSFAKENTHIARGINQALESIYEVDDGFKEALENRYFVEEIHDIKLTKAEQEYIDKHKNIKLVIAAEAVPLQYFDSYGNLQGISAMFLREVTNLLGIEFTIVRMGNEKMSWREFAEKNQAQLIIGPTTEQFHESGEVFEYTNTLMESEVVLCTNKQVSPRDLHGKIYAMVKDGDQPEINKNLPMQLVREYANYKEAFDAINEGRADYTYCNQLITSYFILQSDYQNIISLPVNAASLNYKIALVEEDELLQSILNKAIASLTENSKQDIILAGMRTDLEKVEFDEVVNTFGNELMIGVCMIAAALLILMRAKMKDNRALVMEQMRTLKRDQLTDELFYEYDIKHDTFRTSESCFEKFGMPCEVPNYSEYIKNNIGQTPFKRFLQDYKDMLINEEGEIGCVMLDTVDGKTEKYTVKNVIIRNKKGTPILVLGKLLHHHEHSKGITAYTKETNINRIFERDGENKDE